MIRNHVTPAGAALGRELARLVDEAEPRARQVEPAIPPRCASCAFRAGPHVANGSETTLGDALKCVVENVEFQCHEPARAGQPCSGWLMLHLAHPSAPSSVPWPFNDEAAADGGEQRRDLQNEDTPAEGYTAQHTPSPAEGVCVSHTPFLRSEGSAAQGYAQSTYPAAKGLASVETLCRPEGVQRTPSGAYPAADTTEPAPDYARRYAQTPPTKGLKTFEPLPQGSTAT